jgi:cytoskeletal protein CcmA (bactofilin family)
VNNQLPAVLPFKSLDHLLGSRSHFFWASSKLILITMNQNLEEINVFWGKNSVLNGRMTSEGLFRLDGKVEGEIFHCGTLIIGETAVIKGKLEVNALTLNGMVEGEVTAKERVEIHSRGKLYGTISTPVLIIQDGGVFEGNCKMGTKSDNEGDLEGAGKALSISSDT